MNESSHLDFVRQFQDVFCADLADRQSAILAAAQKPLAFSSFTETLTEAAWKTLLA